MQKNNAQNNEVQKITPPTSAQELELKAFIYQQAQEMEPYAKQLGSLVVFVEYTDKQKYKATFVLDSEEMKLKFEAINKDPYEAIRRARVVTQEQLNQVLNALDDAGALNTTPMMVPKNMLH